MQDSGREEAAEPSAQPREPPAAAPGLLDDVGRAGRAFKQLFGAQLKLLTAELGLARSAVSWMLLAALGATVAGVGLGLSLLALAGVLLAKWLGSWIWALLVLVLLQVVFLLSMIWWFRRCMRWLSLPASRSEWRATIRQAMRGPEREQAHGAAAEREDGA
jgi:hypothetical protein